MTVPATVAAKEVAPKVAAKAAPKAAAEKPLVTDSKKPAQRPKTGNKNNNTTVKRRAQNAKSSWAPHLRPAKSTVRYRQILIAEFIVCSAIIMTSPAALPLKEFDKLAEDATVFSSMMQQEAALIIAFFILSTFTVAGPSAARVSAGVGGLMLLAILLRNKNVVTRFMPTSSNSAKVPAADTIPNAAPKEGDILNA